MRSGTAKMPVRTGRLVEAVRRDLCGQKHLGCAHVAAAARHACMRQGTAVQMLKADYGKLCVGDRCSGEREMGTTLPLGQWKEGYVERFEHLFKRVTGATMGDVPSIHLARARTDPTTRNVRRKRFRAVPHLLPADE